MPTAGQNRNGLREIAKTWKIVPVPWHICSGAFVVVPAMGVRSPKRMTGLLFGLPFSCQRLYILTSAILLEMIE